MKGVPHRPRPVVAQPCSLPGSGGTGNGARWITSTRSVPSNVRTLSAVAALEVWTTAPARTLRRSTSPARRTVAVARSGLARNHVS